MPHCGRVGFVQSVGEKALTVACQAYFSSICVNSNKRFDRVINWVSAQELAPVQKIKGDLSLQFRFLFQSEVSQRWFSSSFSHRTYIKKSCYSNVIIFLVLLKGRFQLREKSSDAAFANTMKFYSVVCFDIFLPVISLVVQGILFRNACEAILEHLEISRICYNKFKVGIIPTVCFGVIAYGFQPS